jgi:hypothetical protein
MVLSPTSCTQDNDQHGHQNHAAQLTQRFSFQSNTTFPGWSEADTFLDHIEILDVSRCPLIFGQKLRERLDTPLLDELDCFWTRNGVPGGKGLTFISKVHPKPFKAYQSSGWKLPPMITSPLCRGITYETWPSW